MKRIISIALTLVLMLLSFSDGMISYALTPAEKELDVFANELATLVRDYAEASSGVADGDDYKFDFPLYYNPSVNEYFTAENVNNHNYIDISSELEALNKTAEEFETNRLIVKSQKSINYCGAVDVVSGYKDLYILQYDTLEETVMAYKYYLSCKNVEYVEPDFVVSAEASEPSTAALDGSASEVYYEIVDKVESWHTSENGFEDIKEELAQTKLAPILVAVLDSGVDTDHEIFENRLVESNVNLSSSGEENSCEDDYGHGTHVAGIVVDNTLSNVTVKPYKVLNNRGKGTVSLIAIAVDLAVQDGADIINMSLSSQGESQTMTDSVNAAVENNVNVVVAAGNNRADLSKTYYTPACIESAITVSACTKDYELASYSSYNGAVDIAAFGDDVKSAYLNNTYTLLDGTSMAAPQVAAGIAIVRSVFTDLSIAEVENKIKEYAIKMDEDENTNYFGAGLLYLKYILSKMPKTADPVFSVDDSEFSSTFKLTITCPEADAKILYVIHSGDEVENIGFVNGTEYTEPITVSVNTKISAVAYTKGKLFSSIVTHEYKRNSENEEDNYDIDENGMITGYFGSASDITVPQVIRGITVTGVGEKAFSGKSDIHSVSLPETATVISAKAFYECSNLQSVTGSGITTVCESAFELSTIESFPFEQLTFIGESAFSGCNNLANVNLTNAVTVEASAFENAKSLVSLDSNTLTTIGESAFRGTDVLSANLPALSEIPKNAFENCADLVSVNAQNVTELKANAFENCISLTEVNMPKLAAVGNSTFKNTGLVRFSSSSITSIGNYAFSSNSQLVAVNLPNVTKVGSYAFEKSPQLRFMHLPKLNDLGMCAFSNCTSLTSLWLPSLTKVVGWGFRNSSVEYLQLDSAEKILSLPDTLTALVVSSKLTSITVSAPETDFTVYGYAGTYAQEYAEKYEKTFTEVPVIIAQLPETVDVNEKYIYAYSFGFNLTYQWYKNDAVSNAGGVPIEGAVNFWYEPNKDDGAVAYYCVITSDDGNYYRQIASPPITNSPHYRQADLTDYYIVIEETNNIDRDLYTLESLSVIDELLSIDVSSYSLAEQESLNSLVQSIKDAISSLAYDYSLGDINDDGKVSLIDVRLVLKVIAGSESFDKLETLAADLNQDGKISLIDVRMILKIISGESVS